MLRAPRPLVRGDPRVLREAESPRGDPISLRVLREPVPSEAVRPIDLEPGSEGPRSVEVRASLSRALPSPPALIADRSRVVAVDPRACLPEDAESRAELAACEPRSDRLPAVPSAESLAASVSRPARPRPVKLASLPSPDRSARPEPSDARWLAAPSSGRLATDDSGSAPERGARAPRARGELEESARALSPIASRPEASWSRPPREASGALPLPRPSTPAEPPPTAVSSRAAASQREPIGLRPPRSARAVWVAGSRPMSLGGRRLAPTPRREGLTASRLAPTGWIGSCPSTGSKESRSESAIGIRPPRPATKSWTGRVEKPPGLR